MNTYNLHGIEIFATGKWNGDEYTLEDLNDMVAAFSQLDFRPPLKAGHSDAEPERAGMPALGWIENLRVIGNKLIADFTHLPELVYTAIKDRRYAQVSAEIYWNLERGGKNFRRALKALSILGAEIPAVAGLRPLYEYFSARYATTYAELPEGAKAYACKLHAKDDDDKPDLKGKKMDITKEAFDALAAKVKTFEDAAKAQEAAAAAKVKAAEDELKAYKERAEADAKARDARLAALEAERRKADLDAVADRCRVPALRPYIRAFQEAATLVSGTRVYGADGKETDATAMVSALIDAINKDAAKLFGVASTANHVRPDAAIGGMTQAEAGAEVGKRVAEYRLKDTKADYRTALNAVLNADPDLKAAYAAAA